jgi:hypothetical protein
VRRDTQCERRWETAREAQWEAQWEADARRQCAQVILAAADHHTLQQRLQPPPAVPAPQPPRLGHRLRPAGRAAAVRRVVQEREQRLQARHVVLPRRVRRGRALPITAALSIDHDAPQGPLVVQRHAMGMY